MSRIIITVEHAEDGKTTSSRGSFITDGKKIKEISKLSKDTLDNCLSNVITEYLVK